MGHSNQIKSNQIKESGEQTEEKASQGVSHPKIKTGAGSIPENNEDSAAVATN